MTDQAMPPTLPYQPAAPKTSGLAIGSMICGIVSIVLCLMCLSGIPAVILGILALTNISKSAGMEKGRGMAIAGIVTGGIGTVVMPIIAVLAAILLPAILATVTLRSGLDLAKEKANRSNCMGQMRQVMLACKAYANDDVVNQYFPANLQALVDKQYVVVPPIFRCPSSRESAIDPQDVDATSDIVYCGAGLKDDGSVDTIILYCKAHHGGCNVFYADGHGAWKSMSAEEIQKLVDAQHAELQKESDR